MKGKSYILIFAFTLWVLITLILTLSVIGMIIFTPSETDRRPSTWMTIGLDLKSAIVNLKDNDF